MMQASVFSFSFVTLNSAFRISHSSFHPHCALRIQNEFFSCTHPASHNNTHSPNIMRRQPRGGLQHLVPGRGTICCCAAHAWHTIPPPFFLRHLARKGGSVPSRLVLGFGRRVGGREGREETRRVYTDVRFVWHAVVCPLFTPLRNKLGRLFCRDIVHQYVKNWNGTLLIGCPRHASITIYNEVILVWYSDPALETRHTMVYSFRL